jgi:glutathione S-transferase-like protein
MTDKHILYGTEFSLYSGKARCYLRYKRIPYDEVLSSLGVNRETIIPKTGIRVIPVVKTPDGRNLQNTSNIIDSLEKSFSERSVLYAHLYRDPYPGSLMRLDAPNVTARVERMIRPTDNYEEWLAADEIPETLKPIFERLFAEY